MSSKSAKSLNFVGKLIFPKFNIYLTNTDLSFDDNDTSDHKSSFTLFKTHMPLLVTKETPIFPDEPCKKYYTMLYMENFYVFLSLNNKDFLNNFTIITNQKK